MKTYDRHRFQPIPGFQGEDVCSRCSIRRRDNHGSGKYSFLYLVHGQWVKQAPACQVKD